MQGGGGGGVRWGADLIPGWGTKIPRAAPCSEEMYK